MTRFEDWILETSRRAGTHVDKSTSGTYLDNRVAAKYSAWKASKTLPTAKQILDTYHAGVVEYDLGTNAGICMLVMDIVNRMNKEDL